MEDIISEKIVLNPNKKKELNLLLNKLRTTIDGVANTSLNVRIILFYFKIDLIHKII